MRYPLFVLLAFLFSFLLSVSRGNADYAFAPTVDQKVRDCLHSYRQQDRLRSGAIYGDSVRRYSLEHKSAREIRTDMRRLGCTYHEDVLRDPGNNQPILHERKTIPLWAFLCPDGGEVRVKPVGNPVNSYRSQPNATKGLRYPFDSKFEGFSDEVVKVDNRGMAIPKSRADLGPQQFVDAWAIDAHTDLIP